MCGYLYVYLGLMKNFMMFKKIHGVFVMFEWQCTAGGRRRQMMLKLEKRFRLDGNYQG